MAWHPKIYLIRDVSPESALEAYRALGIEIPGKVAVKIHSGEKGNTNFLGPEFWKPVVDEVEGTIVECNTAYGDRFDGVRDSTEKHLELMEEHGWSEMYDVDIMDSEGPDKVLEIPTARS